MTVWHRHPLRSIALLLLALICVAPAMITATSAPANAASAIDGPITREEILSRAQFWVDRRVPYSMEGSYPDAQGKNYRTDCSGIVAMGLHLSWSPNTVSLPEFLNPIGWEDLRPGDIVGTLGPGTGGANGHVVLFTGWANGNHTRFFTLEQKGDAGAVRFERPINFPVGSFTAKPYRYKKVIETTPRSSSSFESGQVVSGRSADGRLETFAAGADGIYHAWQTRANGDWSRWEFLGGPKDAELALAPNADGRLELFALNGTTFDHLWQTAPSGGWSRWENFGTGGHDIAVGTNADGRIEVFASNTTGVFHRYQTRPSGGWGAWEGTQGGGPTNSKIALEATADGRLEVFAVNNNTLDHLWQTAPSGGWSRWENFGTGGHDITSDHNADGRIEIFASNANGVFHKWQTGPNTWSPWEGTQGGPANAQLTSERATDGRIEVFAINNATAAHIWQTRPNTGFAPWANLGTGGTAITSARNADGRIEVIAANPNGIFHKWQTGFTTWSNWAWLNDAGPGIN